MRDEPAPAHLSVDQLAALLDRRLERQARERAFRHLAACDDCRREYTELRTVIDRSGRTGSIRRLGIAIAVAAVAVFLVIPAVSRDGSDQVPVGSLTRGSEGPTGVTGNAAMTVISPPDAAEIGRPALTLTWHPAGNGAAYLVTVKDTSGAQVWQVTRSDTSALVPDNVSLRPGARYFWSVEALLRDGQTTRTTLHSFTVR